MLGLYSGSFIQAMGGQLQIKAVFPEGEVQIEQFEGVVAPTADSGKKSRHNLRRNRKNCPSSETSGLRIETWGTHIYRL
jgi:hypothetical protein